jgi:hypothetical protein
MPKTPPRFTDADRRGRAPARRGPAESARAAWLAWARSDGAIAPEITELVAAAGDRLPAAPADLYRASLVLRNAGRLDAPRRRALLEPILGRDLAERLAPPRDEPER